MSTTVKAALLQTDWAGTQESMLDKHEQFARGCRGPGRAGHLLSGALLRAVLRHHPEDKEVLPLRRAPRRRADRAAVRGPSPKS